MITEAEKFAKQQGFSMIQLGAQLPAEPFYEKMGYHKYGEVFLDAGMEHIAMKKTYKKMRKTANGFSHFFILPFQMENSSVQIFQHQKESLLQLFPGIPRY